VLVPAERLFATVAADWHANASKGWCDQNSKQIWARVAANVLPAIGQMAIDEIEPLDVLAALQKIEARGAVDSARRVRADIGSIFDFAETGGMMVTNPATNKLNTRLMPKPKVTHFPALKDKDVEQFFADLREWPGAEAQKIGGELMMHCFVRTKELRYARWAEVKGDLWSIPGPRTKKSRLHLVPLTPRVLELLARLKVLAKGSPFFFPNARTREGVPEMGWFRKPLIELGYKGEATPHGFRGLASTVLNENKRAQRFGRDAIELQLAHVEKNVTRGSYNAAEYLPERREMMLWWSDHLEAKRSASDLIGARQR
jgi:integrase